MIISFEGIDGSGKSSQFERFTKHLAQNGTDFREVKFPRYGEKSAVLLEAYLAGEFGTDPGDVNAYAAGSFFAADRYASYKADWGRDYASGKLLVFDRYTGSNAIHQGAKFSDSGSREEYFAWLRDYEYTRLGLPKPNLTVYFDVSPETSMARLTLRDEAGGGSSDIHETDIDFLRAGAESGRAAAAYFNWSVISGEGDPDTIFAAFLKVVEKANFREVVRSRIRAIPKAERAGIDDKLCGVLLTLPEWKNCANVFLYESYGTEIATPRIIEELKARGINIAVPNWGSGKMIFVEPLTGREVKYQTGDIIIVPALTIDRKGYRMGKGGGYYDRHLESLPEAITVGLARDALLVDEVPREAHDRQVRILVTECGVTRF
ncbi:MAG: 5-formyltetrahydrofolate cyclo-ligase [Oscillospiraceae bacterium]|jgi:dTMP kinase|nr:5-formyltetrahydrofolate cyclo-ligase [Oscillospiraceae bacterium]